MNRSILIFTLLLFGGQMAFSQGIPYGSNPAAGRYYEVRGIKMYAEVYGSGKPLLLIHGNGGSINAFTQTIPYFAKRYRVIAVDSRAHGKTVDAGDIGPAAAIKIIYIIFRHALELC